MKLPIKFWVISTAFHSAFAITCSKNGENLECTVDSENYLKIHSHTYIIPNGLTSGFYIPQEDKKIIIPLHKAQKDSSGYEHEQLLPPMLSKGLHSIMLSEPAQIVEYNPNCRNEEHGIHCKENLIRMEYAEVDTAPRVKIHNGVTYQLPTAVDYHIGTKAKIIITRNQNEIKLEDVQVTSDRILLLPKASIVPRDLIFLCDNSLADIKVCRLKNSTQKYSLRYTFDYIIDEKSFLILLNDIVYKGSITLGEKFILSPVCTPNSREHSCYAITINEGTPLLDELKERKEAENIKRNTLRDRIEKLFENMEVHSSALQYVMQNTIEHILSPHAFSYDSSKRFITALLEGVEKIRMSLPTAEKKSQSSISSLERRTDKNSHSSIASNMSRYKALNTVTDYYPSISNSDEGQNNESIEQDEESSIWGNKEERKAQHSNEEQLKSLEWDSKASFLRESAANMQIYSSNDTRDTITTRSHDSDNKYEASYQRSSEKEPFHYKRQESRQEPIQNDDWRHVNQFSHTREPHYGSNTRHYSNNETPTHHSLQVPRSHFNNYEDDSDDPNKILTRRKRPGRVTQNTPIVYDDTPLTRRANWKASHVNERSFEKY